MNVIEAFSGTLKKKESEKLPPYEVQMSPELVTQMDAVLKSTGVFPVQPVSFFRGISSNKKMFGIRKYNVACGNSVSLLLITHISSISRKVLMRYKKSIRYILKQ